MATRNLKWALLGALLPIVMLGGATALSCLNGSGGVVRPTISSNSAADTVCAAYSLADTTDWEYTSLSNATCLQYQRSPDKYSNVWCCDEPNCNVPDPLKDNVTRVDNTTVLANATTANATNISTTTSPKATATSAGNLLQVSAGSILGFALLLLAMV